MFLPEHSVFKSLELHESESFSRVAVHSIPALYDEGLIGDSWGFGRPESLQSLTNRGWVPCAGFVYEPTHRGFELYLTAFGRFTGDLDLFLDPDAEFDSFGLPIPKGMPLHDLRQVQEDDREAVSEELCS